MKLQEISAEVFAQLIVVAENLSAEEYARPLGVLSNQSIGKHLRHIVEFYELVLAAYASGGLNYDRRHREVALENEPQVAIDRLRAMSVLVGAYADNQPLRLEAAYSPAAREGVVIDSSYYRELLYNIEHAVHHMAIIRIALQTAFPHVGLPPHFGVAYSTVQHQAR
ncbi:MAG: DinB family protein [Ferruginibacter sp.]|nr:DinB family protein [Cytophagales bacterium]